MIFESFDKVCIFRSKGPAVHGPRCQQDRDLYKQSMGTVLSRVDNLDIVKGSVDDVLVDKTNKTVKGVVLDSGEVIKANTTVITTGTFLGGVLYIGKDRYQGGRFMRTEDEPEPPSNNLSKTLRNYSFPMGRMKTGTPPRISRDSINYTDLDFQPSDTVEGGLQYMSLLNNFKQIQPFNNQVN